MYKEYEVQIKMVQEQWLQLKMKFLLGYNMKTVVWSGEIYFWCEGNNNLVGGLLGEFYEVGGWANLQLVGNGGGLHPSPQQGKPWYIIKYIYIGGFGLAIDTLAKNLLIQLFPPQEKSCSS